MPACIFTCITYRDTSKHPDPGLNPVLSVLYCAMWQCSLLGQGQHLEVSLSVVSIVSICCGFADRKLSSAISTSAGNEDARSWHATRLHGHGLVNVLVLYG